MEFSWPEYWSRQLFPSPRDLPNPGIKPKSPALRQILYQLSHQGSPRSPLDNSKVHLRTIGQICEVWQV